MPAADSNGLIEEGARVTESAGSTPPARPSRPRGRAWLTAIAALSMIGVAGFMIYRQLPEIVGRAPDPTPDPKMAAAEASERGMITSRLEVIRVGSGEEARPVISLARPKGPSKFNDIRGTDQGIIARELVRQALLIAARDELGLATRDEVLDDVAPAESGKPGVTLGSVFPTKSPSRMLVRRGEGAAAEVLLKHEMGPVPNEVGILAMILPVAETLSRTEFPEVLRGLGVAGKRNAFKPDGALPPQTEARINALGIVEHFAAIRDLHAIIRADGESPGRLGTLARAYAQLGLLTEFQWHPAHKVYKARALLYAQRLVARDPESAYALQIRAFVRSVLGLHQEALDDLEAASKLARGMEELKPPTWIAPIEAYARNELGSLRTMGGPHARLARLLRMLALEYPLATDQSLRAALEVLEGNEECYRAHDAACRVGGVSNLHVATMRGPAAFSNLLPGSLKALPSLPEAVGRAIEGSDDERAAVEALDKAGAEAVDTGEPSWGALAHLIRETRFVQVARRLIFMRSVWSVPVDDYWAEVRPFVAKHRYLPVLEAYALPPQAIRPRFVAFANTVDLTDFESHEPELVSATERSQTARPEKHEAGFAFGHGDALARDLGACLNTADPAYDLAQAKNLLAVSPHSKLAQSLLVVRDWNGIKDRADAWEQKAGDSPLLLSSLGAHYRMEKQFDRARTLLRRSAELSPQRSTYEQLAEAYRAEGDMEGWRKALDEYLAKGVDTGLDHATVRVEIAKYYMDLKQWKDAAPYAEAAAMTWAGWAMECAIQCYEGMGDWDKAEGWVQRLSERYSPTRWTWWYCFCIRTGHGDAESARAWTDAYLDSARGRPDLADPTWAAYYYWLSGSTKRALAAFDELFAAAPSPATAVPLILVADEAADSSHRDEILKQLCTTMKDQDPTSTAIFQLIRDALAAGKPLDLAAVEAVLKPIPLNDRGNLEFYVGKFLLNHGRADEGRAHFRRAANSPSLADWPRQIVQSTVRTPHDAK